MPQIKKKVPNSLASEEVNSLFASSGIDKILTFEDLVLDGSLAPSEVQVLASGKRCGRDGNEKILTELQCEV
jgi:hypothetical protein